MDSSGQEIDPKTFPVMCRHPRLKSRGSAWWRRNRSESPKFRMLRRQRKYVTSASGPSNDVFFIQIETSGDSAGP